MSPDPVCQPSGPAEVHWFGVPLVQANEDVHTVAKVRLGPNQDDGRGWVAGADLWDPFGGDVVKGDRVDQAEAEDEDVHVGIAQRAKMTKLLLSDQTYRLMRRQGAANQRNRNVVRNIYLSCSIYQLDTSWNPIHMNHTWKLSANKCH